MRTLTARTASSVNRPRATPDWLLMVKTLKPYWRALATASAAPSTSMTWAGSPRYPSLTIRVLSRSKKTAGRFIVGILPYLRPARILPQQSIIDCDFGESRTDGLRAMKMLLDGGLGGG